MEKIKEVLVALRALRWYTIILLFLGGVLYTFHVDIKRLIEMQWAEQDVVLEALQSDLLVESALQELLDDTESDRAYIFRFHNGDMYYNGTHKSKMSNDYEVVKLGVLPQASKLQNLPTSLYLSWIKETIDESMFYYDINFISDLRVRFTLKEQGIAAIACAPYYRNGKLFAIIGVDYINEVSIDKRLAFEQNKEEFINSFIKRANEIGNLLI